MRYGFKTAPQNTTYADVLACFRVADQLEVFESGWLFDHFEPIFTRTPHGTEPGDRSGPCLEGWTTLAALAQATERLRLGLMVTGNPYRHPSVLANMAATVDVLSEGRLELGIGAGWNQDEADALGIDLPPLKERFDRFDEALEVVTRLLSQDVSDFEGEHHRLRGAYCEPKPLQRPHPPIVIGGSGPKRTLRATARFAQHWNQAGGTPSQMAESLEVLHRHCADLGRDPDEITVSTQLRFDDPAEIPDLAASFAAVGCDLCILYIDLPHEPAKLEAIAEVIG